MIQASIVTPPHTLARAGSVPCPVCDGHPIVALAIRHSVMRRFTRELLERDLHCWVIVELDDIRLRDGALRTLDPDLLVIDGGSFPDCCQAEIAHFPPNRVVVVGVDPDTIYATTALAHGAGAWITGDQLGDQLEPAMRRVLGCTQEPCHSVLRPLTAINVPGTAQELRSCQSVEIADATADSKAHDRA